MSSTEKSLPVVVAKIRRVRDYHLMRYKELNGVIDVLNKNNEPQFDLKNRGGRKPTGNNFGTFITSAIKSAGRPMTITELMDLYNSAKGSVPTYKNFTSMLLKVKQAGFILRHVQPGFPVKYKGWFGLTEWFVNDSLDDQYIDKINKAAQGGFK